MNVFYTNHNIKECAKDHCTVHVRKMIVEYTQLLSTAHRKLDGYLVLNEKNKKHWFLSNRHKEDILYKATHINHPSAQWVMASRDSYIWLYKLTTELLRIYKKNSGKVHKVESSGLIDVLKDLPENLIDTGWYDPFLAINNEQYTQIVKDFYQGHISTKEAYRQYLNKKYKEWSIRDNKRKIKAEWYVSKPDWVTI